MTVMADDTRVTRVPRIHWAAIASGALTAAALGTVLHSFAVAIGLGVSSASPTWRDSSIALVLLSGIYLILVALASYGLGGYVAGWVRSWSPADDADAETTNGLHGLLVWALATLMTALILGVAVASVAQVEARTAANTGPGMSGGGENLVAYDIDRLLRADGRYPATDAARARGEAGRILLTSSSHSGVNPEDRTYLVRLVAAQTNLAPPDAERRVDATIIRAKESINRARRGAVILAFMVGAAALLGAAAAWFAAIAGASHAVDHPWTIWAPRPASTPSSLP